MASIVKRGKTYSVVYYEGKGSNRHQIWESGLSYLLPFHSSSFTFAEPLDLVQKLGTLV